MKKFINEATENFICEDIISKFEFFDESVIRDYIVESYGVLDEAFMGSIVSKVKSGIGQVASDAKDWVLSKIKEIKNIFGATRVTPFIEFENGKRVYRFLARKTQYDCLVCTSSGVGIVGYHFDPAKNAGTVVFRNINSVNKEIISNSSSKVANEGTFLNKLTLSLLEAKNEDDDSIMTTIGSDDKNFKRASSEHEINSTDEVSKGLESDMSGMASDLVGMLGKEKSKRITEPAIPGTSQYVENTNIVSVRELKKIIGSLMAQAMFNSKQSDPPRMYIAGPPGTAKTQIVESFANSSVVYIDENGKTVDTGDKWQLHILEVDKLFAEIFAGFPVEEMISVLKKDPSERTESEQDLVDQASSTVSSKRKKINAASATPASEEDYAHMSQTTQEKRIKLLQTDLLPPNGADGYHIFFFDELNRGTPEKIGAVMNLLYQGKIGSSYRVPKHSVMISAGNVGDGKIDFEKVKQLFGTFYTRMQHVVTTNYDWSERARYGREYEGPKVYGVSTFDKQGNMIPKKVTVDMGNKDPTIVTNWLHKMIDKYGNSFSYKLQQLNPNDPAYSLDYRVISNISKKMKSLAVSDWFSKDISKIDVNGNDKEFYESVFDKLDATKKQTYITSHKYNDGDLEYETAKWSSPQQIYMTANSKYYFKKAFADTFSNSSKAENLLNLGLTAYDEKIGNALRISKDDIKYSLALHTLDEKYLAMAEGSEGGEAIQKFVNDIRNTIVTTKSGTKFWKDALSYEPDLVDKINEVIKQDKDKKSTAIKILKAVVHPSNDDEVKGIMLFTANLQVLFDRMKTGGGGKAGVARKDYMKEVADEIDRATEDAASLEKESDRASIEKFVDTITSTLSKADPVFKAARGSNLLKYSKIGDAMPDSSSTPASFMIMSYFMKKNPNAYLTLEQAKEVSINVQNKYLDGSLKSPTVVRVEDFLPDSVINSNFEDFLLKGPGSIANYTQDDIDRMKETESNQTFGKQELNEFDMMRVSKILSVFPVVEKAEIKVRKRLELHTKEEVKTENIIDERDTLIIEENFRKLFK